MLTSMASIKSNEELDRLKEEHCYYKLQTGLDVYDGYTLPTVYGNYLEVIENFEVFDDDVWVTSVPKAGTTWMQEIVWCISNNLDFEAAKAPQRNRFPFLELPYLRDELDHTNPLIGAKRPRFIKSHLPWNLMPKQLRKFEKRPKIVHVMRNPKDVCVSYYHHNRLLENYTGDFELFWQLFIKDKVKYCPIIKNMLTFWEHRDEPNILLLKYEDMKVDLKSACDKVANFLGKKLSEDEMQKLLEHVSFDSMRKNPSTNHVDVVGLVQSFGVKPVEGQFIRRGVAGAYKSKMRPEVIQLFDEWMEENLAGTDLRFD